MTDTNYKPPYKHVTIHEFKTHMSRLLSMLERGVYRGLIVKRHKTPVAMVVAMNLLDDDK